MTTKRRRGGLVGMAIAALLVAASALAPVSNSLADDAILVDRGGVSQ